MKPHQKNYAFIDSQNLNLSVRAQGWKLDFKRFRKYIEDKYGVVKAFLFIGFVPEQQSLYTALQEYGYVIIFKPTLTLSEGRVKGNVDAELVLHAMIEFPNYDQAVIVTGDGDFHCLVEYLKKQGKLRRLLIPQQTELFRSSQKVCGGHGIYKRPAGKAGIRGRKIDKKREALPRDGTLWLAPHRDSIK